MRYAILIALAIVLGPATTSAQRTRATTLAGITLRGSYADARSACVGASLLWTTVLGGGAPDASFMHPLGTAHLCHGTPQPVAGVTHTYPVEARTVQSCMNSPGACYPTVAIDDCGRGVVCAIAVKVPVPLGDEPVDRADALTRATFDAVRAALGDRTQTTERMSTIERGQLHVAIEMRESARANGPNIELERAFGIAGVVVVTMRATEIQLPPAAQPLGLPP